jgi:predicted nucleotidyltransferase
VAALILQDLDELKRQIAPHVQRARKVVAFGSVARGESDAWPRLDLLIYTPEEFERMLAEDNPIVTQAVQEGVVLHQAAQG